MRKVFAVVIMAGFLASVMGGPAAATAPMKRYPNCAALLKAYPAGVAKDKRSAAAAVKDGQRRPAVRPKVYRDNAALDRDKDGTACEQPSPRSRQAVIRTEFGFVVAPLVKVPASGQCTDIPVTYDIRNPDRVPRMGMFFDIADDFENAVGSVFVRPPNQTGSIRVCGDDWQDARGFRRVAAQPGVTYRFVAVRVTGILAGEIENETTYAFLAR